ncbi:hypothetical protein Tco_0427585, partial [Tanacetum coccineum]
MNIKSLSATKAIQADCDIKATNIILQGLPPEVYALVSNHKVAKELWERIQLLMQGTSLGLTDPGINQQPEFSQPDLGLIVLVFQKGDDPIDAINHMMSFLTAVVTSRYLTTNNQLRNSSNPRQQATINNGRVTVQPIQRRQTSLAAGTTRTYTPHEQVEAILGNKGLLSVTTAKGKATCPNSALNLRGNGMILDLGIPEGNDESVQNSNSSAQQDALILSVTKQLKTQVVNYTKINLDNKSVNDTLTAELERYKEQVKVLKEGQN